MPRDVWEQYAEDVVSGRIVAGKYIRLACERFFRDLQTGHERGLWFDVEAAQFVIDFFSLLTPSKGEFQSMDLMAWQQFAIANLFGWKKADGYRRFVQAWFEVARKNGKSAIGSGLGLYMLCADGERGAEVYSAGIDRAQSRIVFDEAVAMVDASPDLQELIKKAGQQEKNVQRLYIADTKSHFEPCSRDSRRKQGYNVHCAVLDEVHVHEDNGEMWDAMRFGMRFRKQPLLVGITTAGLAGKPTVCSKKHETAVKVLEGVLEDDGLFAMIFSLDEDDDWEDERNWPKANPSLGHLITLETLRQEALEAKNDPGSLNSFKRYALNMWVGADKQRIPTALWDACRSDNGNPCQLQEALAERLKGRKCVAGLDLAVTVDISALVLLFSPTKEDPRYRFLPFFWIPENNIAERVKRDHVNYDAWARDGYLLTTPGDTTDYSYLCEKIMQLATDYDIRELAFDPAHATPLMNQLQEHGFPVEKQVKYPQSPAKMSYPTKELIRLIMRREIVHEGNPVMRWMISNLVTRTNATGLEYPDKDKSTEKIDGVTALIVALGRATDPENAEPLPKVPRISFF